MTAATFPPVRTATAAATWASRRLRRRRTRREAIGAWWRNRAPSPQIAAATAATAGAGAVLLVAVRRRLARRTAYLEGRVKGAIHHVHSTETAPDNDQTLADKVRTEVFRRPDAPKGAVNVSVVDGVVYLRGEVDSLDQVQHLVDDALAVTGVVGVESMLHTPGTPAPNASMGG
jgi:hypothetical protein